VIQAVESLFSKHETLSSNPSTVKIILKLKLLPDEILTDISDLSLHIIYESQA
jgi:hypothetical protein